MTKKITKKITGDETTPGEAIDYEHRLWEPFKRTCIKVLEAFGHDMPAGGFLPAGFQWMRDSDYSATITYAGDFRKFGGMAEFSIRLTAPHTYGAHLTPDGNTTTHEFYAGPELQNFGKMTPLALILMLAVRPIAFGIWSEKESNLIDDALYGPLAHFVFDDSSWDDVKVETE